MSDFTLAVSVPAKARGLLGTKPHEGVLMLAPCRDIHTYGMTYPLDVAFIAEDGRVLASHRKVGPRRRIRCPGASAVLERAASSSPWYQEGTCVSLAPSAR